MVPRGNHSYIRSTHLLANDQGDQAKNKFDRRGELRGGREAAEEGEGREEKVQDRAEERGDDQEVDPHVNEQLAKLLGSKRLLRLKFVRILQRTNGGRVRRG